MMTTTSEQLTTMSFVAGSRSVVPGFDPSPEARSTALDTTFGLLMEQAGRLLGTDARGEASRRLAHTLWALTHGLVSLELSPASRSPLAHPALADNDGQDSLETALLATMNGWRARGLPPHG